MVIFSVCILRQESVDMCRHSMAYIMSKAITKVAILQQHTHLNRVRSVCKPQQQMTVQIAAPLGLHCAKVTSDKTKNAGFRFDVRLRHFNSHKMFQNTFHDNNEVLGSDKRLIDQIL
jgi:hypothetical protein